MIALRRATQRLHGSRREHETWCTFFAQDRGLPFAEGFGILETLNEDRVPPGAAFPGNSLGESEVVTYVCEGALAHENSDGQKCVTRAGEFRCWTVRNGSASRRGNALRSDWAHTFQIGFRAAEAGPDARPEQKRFSAAERRGGLCAVASPDGRAGSLRLRQDASVYSALIVSGHHLIHELPPGRSAWLHIVQGEVTLGNLVLTTGDGIGISAERGVSLTARTEAELLLVDLGEQLPPNRAFGRTWSPS